MQATETSGSQPLIEKTYPNLITVQALKQMTTEGPLVSAIIPTHNRAAMLTRAILSVQLQTYPHLEIIVVDDASQDNTSEVIKEFDDPRIRYIRHKKNKGGSASRNTGIRAATGEFIAFLDDDDEWVPEKTEEQLKLLHSYDVVTCTSDSIGGDLPKHSLRKTLELIDLQQGPWGGTGVLMAKTSVLKEMMFDESLPRGQDWDLFIRIALKHKIGYINKPLLRYDCGDHPRITNSARILSIQELEKQLRVVEKYKKLFGLGWYKKNMSKGLLYGIKDRPDKIALLMYTARRYGLYNVVHGVLVRVLVRLRKSVKELS